MDVSGQLVLIRIDLSGTVFVIDKNFFIAVLHQMISDIL